MKLYITWTWDAVGAVASLIAAVLVPISLCFLWRQIREMRNATYAQAFAVALGLIQNEEIRAARSVLFSLSGKPLDEWTEEEKQQAERVCQGYDAVGIMVNNGMLPKSIMTKNWKTSLERSWEAAAPLVQQRRTNQSAPELWDDFESLAKQAPNEKVHQAHHERVTKAL